MVLAAVAQLPPAAEEALAAVVPLLPADPVVAAAVAAAVAISNSIFLRSGG